MGVPKSHASLSLFASLSLKSQSPRDISSRLATLHRAAAHPFFYLTTPPSPTSSSHAQPQQPGNGNGNGTAARSIYTSAGPPPNGGQTYYDPSLTSPGDGIFGPYSAKDGPSNSSSSSLPATAPSLPSHPAPFSKSHNAEHRTSTSDPTSTSTSSTTSSSDPSSATSTSSHPAPLRGPHTIGTSKIQPYQQFLNGGVNGFKVPKRENFVFRNGAAGIPKAGHGGSGDGNGKGGGGKGKAKMVERDPGACGSAKKGNGNGTVKGEGEEGREGLSVQVGEDAYFLRADGLGVADGVGGWSGHAGANAAAFAKKLMHHCSRELSRYEDVDDVKFLSYYDVDPVEVLQGAYEKCLHEAREEGIVGSSTALLAVLRKDELRVANMGDCCCSIIRGTDYIFRSEEQQHSFNYPVQVGTSSKDTPEKDAQRFTVKVQKNDIVILSSDGLVDNLFDEDILEEVLLSEALCWRAKAVSEDQQAVTSPFAQRAMEEGIHFVGGKNDDISVLIAVVQPEEDSPDRR